MKLIYLTKYETNVSVEVDEEDPECSYVSSYVYLHGRVNPGGIPYRMRVKEEVLAKMYSELLEKKHRAFVNHIQKKPEEVSGAR